MRYAASRTAALLLLACTSHAAIDRVTVVTRHNPLVVAANASELDTRHDTLSLGNGAFAFNVDITGLQTFNASYGFGTNTFADWGWHVEPFTAEDPLGALHSYNWTIYNTPTNGAGATRPVPYCNAGNGSSDASRWMMSNPHRLNLGQLSLRMFDAATRTTAPVSLSNIANASQELSLWAGALSSNFSLVPALPQTCEFVDDNLDATFRCGVGETIASVAWASYGRPSGTCASGFVTDPTCNAANSSAVLAAMCVGRSECSFHVSWLAGFGDPCPGHSKRFAGIVTCSASAQGAPPSTPASALAVRVQTVVDPDIDLVSVFVECDSSNSSSSSGGGCPLALRLAFPYGSGSASGADWGSSASHTTTVVHNSSSSGRGSAVLLRRLDSDAYRVDCAWDGGLVLLPAPGFAHTFELVPGAGAGAWPAAGASVSCLFSPVGDGGVLHYPVGEWTPWLATKANLTRVVLTSNGAAVPLHPLVSAAARLAWAAYWEESAFVDLASRTVDPSAFELERRVVLSQYLMRVNSAGAEPPPETGFLVNSWGGKHHNEMRFWHLAHWALWGHPELLARSDAFFTAQLQNATSYATFQGYPGAHWPKETGAVANRSASVPWLGLDATPWPFGGVANGSILVWESPQVANALVMWQQPHVIWLADVQRRAANASGGSDAALAVVRAQAPLVAATADYLAARLFFNESMGRYSIGPPVLGGQECGNAELTTDPLFELVYVGLTLDIANEWLGWLGQPSNPAYEAVASSLAPLHVDPASPPGTPLHTFDRGCVCQFLPLGDHDPACKPEWVPPTGSNCPPLREHPLMLGVLGMINGRAHGDRYGVDVATANNTLAAVWANWAAWGGAWGWDDSLLASGMARLGWSPRSIVDGPLADPKFPYYKNGHTLCCPVYLPGNGGLLLSIAMLAAGSDTSPPMHFPLEWDAQAEGFNVPYP